MLTIYSVPASARGVAVRQRTMGTRSTSGSTEDRVFDPENQWVDSGSRQTLSTAVPNTEFLDGQNDGAATHAPSGPPAESGVRKAGWRACPRVHHNRYNIPIRLSNRLPGYGTP